MKNTVLLVSVLLFSVASYGQSTLDKFLSKKAKKEAKETPKVEEKIPTPVELAAVDSASTFLNDKEIKKDSRGLSGIYYSNIPIRASMFLGGDKKFVKKFLVNYNEDEKLYNTIHINTQYGYETTDKNKWVRTAKFASGSSPASANITTALKAGYVWLNAADTDNGDYEYLTHNSTTDLQGNTIPAADYFTSWRSSDEILEVEPGILLIGDFWHGNEPRNNIAYKKKYSVIVVLYKAEKAQAAAIYTNEVCWDKVVEFQQKFDGTYKKASSDKFEMRKPVMGFKDEPKAIDVTNAAKAFNASYQPSYKFEYAYVVSEWKNVYEQLGVNKQNTLVARVLEAAVIATKNGECGVTYVKIKQQNTFTTGSLSENFGANVLVARDASVVNTVDCVKANKYKK